MKLRRLFASVSLCVASTAVSHAALAFGFTESLSDSISSAINNIPAIKSERFRLQGFEQEVKEARSSYRPSVTASGSLGYQHVNNNSTRTNCNCNGYVDGDRHNFDITMRYNLWDAGGKSNRKRAAKSRVKGQTAKVKDFTEIVASEMVSAYVGVLRHRSLVDLARENVAKGEELTTIVSLQVEKGKAASVDNALASSRLEKARADLEGYMGDLKSSEIRFAKLTGHVPGDLEVVELRTEPALEDEQIALNEGLANHPAIIAATEQMNAIDAEAAAAKETYRPRFDLELSYVNERNANGVLGDDDDYQAKVIVSYDLYAGGRDVARAKRDQFLADASRYDLDNVKLDIQEEIQLAFSGLQTTSKNLVHLSKQIEADDKILSAYTSQLQIGRRTPLDVFVVQDSLFQSRIKERDTFYQKIVAQHQLLSAMGQLNQSLGMSI